VWIKILKWALDKVWNLYWIKVAQDTVQWRALLNTVMELWVL